MPFNNAANNLFRQQKVVNSAGNYVALADDVIINISNTAAPRTVTLPAPSNTNVGKTFLIKDSSGGAGTNNITVTSASGNIDGAASYVLNRNFSSLDVYSDGTNYFSSAPLSEGVATPLASFKARKSSAQVIPNTIFTTVIGFQAADFDITNAFVPATGIFTAPRASRYLCIGSVIYIDMPVQPNIFMVSFAVNGIGIGDRNAQLYYLNAAAITFPITSVTTILDLNQNDIVGMITFQTTGANANLQTDANFNFFAVQELKGDL